MSIRITCGFQQLHSVQAREVLNLAGRNYASQFRVKRNFLKNVRIARWFPVWKQHWIWCTMNHSDKIGISFIYKRLIEFKP